MGITLQKRDCSDTQLIIDYLKKASPFQGDGKILRNIATGLSAKVDVNVDNTKLIGEKIIGKMEN